MPMPEWTIGSLLSWAAGYLQKNDIDSPRTTADLLLAHSLGIRRLDLYLRYDQPLHTDELARFKQLIRRRLSREPVAYITGTKEFWSLELEVTPDVLIPRPETECLVEAVLEEAGRLPAGHEPAILDLGTGSGAIVLALAKSLPRGRFVATDASIPAIRVARRNAGRHGLEHRIQFVATDWLAAFHPGRARFDVIVSNPPYIDRKDLGTLAPEVREFEPVRALDGNEGGLECLERILAEAPAFLNPGGLLVMEIGYDQRSRLEQSIRSIGAYEEAFFRKDYAGHDRVVGVKRMRSAGRRQ
ncbi:MAG: peptide chain release factor N(5)-glutamine methyltransferase [Desulfobacterales bacterium]